MSNNPNNPAFPRYGGRGIQFRFSSFEEFLEEVGFKPTPKHSIERKDNNGHYEKGNIRWATNLEQQRNKRTNHLLIVHGESKTISEWAEIYNISKRTILWRVCSGKYCDSCAVTLPFHGKCEHNSR